MSLKGMYKAEVVTCAPDALVTEAAQMMKDRKVGNIVVVDGANGSRKPVGMITDRDIMIGAVCGKSVDLKSLKVSQVMSSNLITINEDEAVFDALAKMRKNGIARVPVIDKSGALCGVLSAKRIFKFLNNEMTEFSTLSDRRIDMPHAAGASTSASAEASQTLRM